MKKDILKIAGVKSEKEFYKLFPSEQAFMKVHGKAFKKAKMGASMVSKQLTQLTDFANPPQAQNGINQGLQGFGKTLNNFSTGANNVLTKANTSLGKIGGVKGAVEIGTGLMQGIQQIGEEKEARNKAKQFKELSGLTKQVAGLTPEMTKRKYSRPEDFLVDPGQLNPSYGTGDDVLSAEQGMQIGGNPTELQNMYSSGDIYSDMGYEPFGESDRMKQYRKGGSVEKAQFGKMAGDFGGALGSLIGGGKGLPTAGGTIGGNIGNALGKFTLIPGADAILGGIGGLVGGIFGGASAKKTQGIQDEANKNLQDAAFMQGTQKFQNQNAAFMENGGWVSHDWQPQVITQFGGYDMKDLLKKDDTMDTLRAGGHLKDYTAPSERAMSTERPQFAMGGKLKTHWGGDTELISYNPYMPGSGETHMVRGNYHSQSDGNGNTGVGISYSGRVIEAEKGEPITQAKEGDSLDNEDVSAVVFGNLPITKYIASEINDPKAANETFKFHVKKLNDKENEQNKLIDKSLTLINSVEGDSPFDTLTLNSGKATILGANYVQKDIADKKIILAGGQNAILDTAKEMNLDVEALARNKIKKAKKKNTSTAQVGATVLKDYQNPNVDISAAARFSKFMPYTPMLYPLPPYAAKTLKETSLSTPEFMQPVDFKKPFTPYTPEGLPDSRETDVVDPTLYDRLGVDKYFKYKTPKQSNVRLNNIPSEEASSPNTQNLDFLRTIYNEALPYMRETDQMPLDPAQLYGEMYAMQSNVPQGVQSQMYRPLLETEPAALATAQSQLNEITASANAARRMTGNNPAAQAMIASQEAQSKQQVLGQQMAANIQAKEAARQRNIGALNDATLKNLAILDNQYTRQTQANANTKATAQAALNSIASKIGQNKLENRQLGVMENMYNFRYDKSGRAINKNPLVDFQAMLDNASPSQLDEYSKMTETTKKGRTSSAKNGSIVKAIKNL